MSGFSLKSLFVNLVLALFLFEPFLAYRAAAKTIVVVDVDGTANNYAALTTVLKHPQVADNLRLVTVSGATYGYASTVVQNICSFLSLAGRPSVSVAMGQLSAVVDAYNTLTKTGDCKRSQGFPATPHDASLRGMMYSKADVTSAFGQSYRLPRITTAAENCMNAIDSATNSLLTLVQECTSEDKIVYLQLGSGTNLARILDFLGSSGNLSSLFYSVMQVHALETGYNGGADDEAITKLLSDNKLTLYLYPPVFYVPSLAFNDSTWGRFLNITQRASSSELVRWLFEVLNAKMNLFQHNGGNATNFYNEIDLASSLVTLCALDETLGNLCKQYRNAASTITFSYTLPDSVTDNLVLSISGNNLTAPFYYNINTKATGSGTPNTGGNRILSFYNISAAIKVDGASSNLVDKFWELWLNLLQS